MVANVDVAALLAYNMSTPSFIVIASIRSVAASAHRPGAKPQLGAPAAAQGAETPEKDDTLVVSPLVSGPELQ